MTQFERKLSPIALNPANFPLTTISLLSTTFRRRDVEHEKRKSEACLVLVGGVRMCVSPWTCV